MATSSAALNKLNDHSVVVFVDASKDQERAAVPPLAFTALNLSNMGNTIPKAAVVSPDGAEVWAAISYGRLKDDGTYRTVKNRVTSLLDGEPADGLPEIDAAESLWCTPTGTYFTGEFIGIEGDKLVLSRGDGKQNKIASSKLHPNTFAFAQSLVAEAEAAALAEAREAAMAAITYEDWTSADGATITAKFVSLEADTVTIQREGSDKLFPLPLSKLSDPSQARAREIAASLEPAG